MKMTAIFLGFATSFICLSNIVPTNAWSQTARVQYSYDNLNRLVQAACPDGRILQYSYDNAGNRIATNVSSSGTSTTVTSSASPMEFGGTATFTATVTDTSFQNIVPTGTVQFAVDNSPLGPPVALSGGTATSPPWSANQMPGGHNVTATFTSSENFASSSGQSTQDVQIENIDGISVSGAATNYPETKPYQASLSVNVECGWSSSSASPIPPASTRFTVDASPSSITVPRLMPAMTFVGPMASGTFKYIYARDRYYFISTSVPEIGAIGQPYGGSVAIAARGALNGTSGYTMVLEISEKDFEVYIYNPDGSLKFHGPDAPIAAGTIAISSGVQF